MVAIHPAAQPVHKRQERSPAVVKLVAHPDNHVVRSK